MGYKLAVSDEVIVPIKVVMKDGGKEKKFAFELVCDRVPDDEFQARIRDEELQDIVTNEKIRETMIDITTGWRGQTLVLGDDGEPADFSKEAFEVMLDASGMLDAVSRSYVQTAKAKVKN